MASKRANTMNTSDLPAGFPDAAVLEKLANQFFSALPNGAPAPTPNFAPPTSAPSIPASFPAPGHPGEGNLRSLLGTPEPRLAQAAQAAPAEPPFYFLDYTLQRPGPVSGPASVPASPLSLIPGIPDESDLRALLGTPEPPVSQPPSPSESQFYFLDYSLERPAPGPGPATPVAHGTPQTFDVHAIRRDFPILREQVNGRPLIWLDNAATTQKPKAVIDRLTYFYEHENSNIHRAAHELAARATDAYEGAREKVRAFLNAASTNEIVFVRGATEAINLVAKSWGSQNLGKDDEILVSHLEHHANIVPWQQLAAATGARLRVIPVDDDGQLRLEALPGLLSPKTKLVAFAQVSNALGTVTPAKQIIEAAHAVGAKVLLDGAQSVSHMRVDLQALNPDFFVFSGHKVFAPTGIGVLYGREAILNETAPWQGGGNMIEDVTFESTRYHKAPARFEAGTGNIADAVGLGAAIDYVQNLGMDRIAEYEHNLLQYATLHLKAIPGLRLIGTAPDKASVLSFVLAGYKTEEVGAALNREGIAVRSGHHCAQPILRRFGVEATVRPSLAFYNTCEEVDKLVEVVTRLAQTNRPAGL